MFFLSRNEVIKIRKLEAISYIGHNSLLNFWKQIENILWGIVLTQKNDSCCCLENITTNLNYVNPVRNGSPWNKDSWLILTLRTGLTWMSLAYDILNLEGHLKLVVLKNYGFQPSNDLPKYTCCLFVFLLKLKRVEVTL